MMFQPLTNSNPSLSLVSGSFLNFRTVTWPKMTCRMQAIKANAAVIPSNVENKLISSSYSPKTPRELSNTNNAPKTAEVMNNQ